MTCAYGNQKDSDYYRAQSTFTGQLVEFAGCYGVHVHLVAHPKKTQKELGNDDVSGMAEITNRAANVFAVERLTEAERVKSGCDTMLNVLKNRWEGATGKIGLCYEPTSRRLYMPSVGDIRCYEWGTQRTIQ
jgi:twinkle protein